jgi:hypothetical protein
MNNNLHEPVWNWTDTYPSGIYKINNDKSIEHIKHEYSKIQTNAAHEKITSFLKNGNNLEEEEEKEEEEGFGERLRNNSNKYYYLSLLIILLFLLLIYQKK